MGALPANRRSGADRVRTRFAPGLCLAALLIPSAAAASIDLQLSDEQPPRVTLSARQEPMEAVLEALSTAADFDLAIDGELGAERADWQFRGRPLPSVLEAITRGLGLTVFYAGDRPGSGEIIEVHVYGRPVAGSRGTIARGAARAPSGAVASATDDGSAERLAALGAFADQSDPGHLELIAGYMRNDPAPEVRRRAIDMLVAQAGDNLFPWLDQCLSDAEASVRQHCVNAMSRLQGPEVFGAMSQVLYGDAERSVRAAAINVLAQLPDAEAGALLELASQDAAMEVQAEAGQALARWRNRQSGGGQAQ